MSGHDNDNAAGPSDEAIRQGFVARIAAHDLADGPAAPNPAAMSADRVTDFVFGRAEAPDVWPFAAAQLYRLMRQRLGASHAPKALAAASGTDLVRTMDGQTITISDQTEFLIIRIENAPADGYSFMEVLADAANGETSLQFLQIPLDPPVAGTIETLLPHAGPNLGARTSLILDPASEIFLVP